MKILILAHEASPFPRTWDGPAATLPLPGGTPAERALALARCTPGASIVATLHADAHRVEQALSDAAQPGEALTFALAREVPGPAAVARRAVQGQLDGSWLVIHAAAGLPVPGRPALGVWRLPPGGLARSAAAGDGFDALLAGVPGAIAPTPLSEARWADLWLDTLAERPGAIVIDPTARVHPDALLVPPAYIGPGCEVGRDAVVGPGVALTGQVVVAAGARIAGSAVLPGTRVLADVRIDGHVLGPRGGVDLASGAYRPSGEGFEAVAAPAPWHARVASLAERALAAGALAALSPVLGLVALAIKLDSPGPVLFNQLRAGQLGPDGRPRTFRLWKFRTMREDAPALPAGPSDGPFVKPRHDPRVTRLGRWLRASSLDELPQLINVARGEMCLVGNRPLPLYEAEALTEDWQALRFRAPAGLTGLWQTSGRSDLCTEERLLLDNYYAAMRTPLLDLRILLATVPALLKRRGAF